MNIKANYRNYFKEGKLYQYDKNRDILIITKSSIQDEFCLDQKGMETLLKLDNPTVKLSGVLEAKSGKTKAKINILNEELILPDMNFNNEFTINVDRLKIANRFVSTNPTKAILTGVNVNDKYIAATDAYTAYKFNCENNCNVVISSEFINNILGYDGELKFKCNDNVISYENEDVTIIGRLLNGNYPLLDKIYNRDFPNVISLDKNILVDLFKYNASKDSKVVFENNKITLKSESIIEIELDLAIEDKILVNTSCLQNIVKSIDGEKMEIHYKNGLNPLLINGEFIVLPMKEE